MDTIYFIMNMDKIVFNNDGTYEIIPCKLSLSVVYKKQVLYNNIFNINYNLYDVSTNKSKFHKAINYLLKNKNIFPTKEHKGKRVIRYINKIGHDPDSVRNFIKSLMFILSKNTNTNVTIVSTDKYNTIWLLNKITDNKLITSIKSVNYPTMILSDINIDNCEGINNICIDIINNKYTTECDDINSLEEDSTILNTILEYNTLIYT
ncbi:unknown similar to AMEV085 [Mythimna separata entomopoxvirus 'L']|uniref:Uncharacterized protein n=1 Tax=Mythimna separata entomopoxvirus 'L' TaxID=1293572 RepID=A0A916P7E3_9POXV|nr:unknown similar to AMEV085 [Mythimna separata entomopoxvirus 'L']CCU56306.1 unknown similar to AMEV085 [Mythimna separata entomopoxvirus 'L']